MNRIVCFAFAAVFAIALSSCSKSSGSIGDNSSSGSSSGSVSVTCTQQAGTYQGGRYYTISASCRGIGADDVLVIGFNYGQTEAMKNRKSRVAVTSFSEKVLLTSGKTYYIQGYVRRKDNTYVYSSKKTLRVN